MHVKLSLWEQPVPFLLRFIYGAGLVVAILACVAFLGYRSYTRRKGKKGEGEKPPGGQGTPS
jgi:hypothetical protein